MSYHVLKEQDHESRQDADDRYQTTPAKNPLATALAGRAPVMFLLTGIQAAGKSTVGQLLAERFPRSAHVRGDLFRRMVVGGMEDPLPESTTEALVQLRLRHKLAATVADGYFGAGFTVVLQDCFLGEYLAWTVSQVDSHPLLVVVLAPRPEEVARREARRAKKAYDPWTIEGLDSLLRERTARVGLWLDTSQQTPEETVDEILSRAWPEARVN
jgi:chloramphenicol 3-O-phosphotransferase